MDRLQLPERVAVELLDTMHTYFRGERMLGFGLAALGLGLLAAAFWVYKTQMPGSSGFAWALLVPLALVGVGGLVGGPILVLKTDAQVAELDGAFENDRAATVASERERMAKVNANWPRLMMGWGALTLVALVLLLGVKKDWAMGLGLGLALIATTFFFVDTFAERRAEPYTESLNEALNEPQAPSN